MARFILAIVAILALAVSPIAATAAPMSCGMSSSSVSADADPCCDKTICATACVAICASAHAVLPTTSSLAVASDPAAPEPVSEPAVHRYRPPGPDHPPKLAA